MLSADQHLPISWRWRAPILSDQYQLAAGSKTVSTPVMASDC